MDYVTKGGAHTFANCDQKASDPVDASLCGMLKCLSVSAVHLSAGTIDRTVNEETTFVLHRGRQSGVTIWEGASLRTLARSVSYDNAVY